MTYVTFSLGHVLYNSFVFRAAISIAHDDLNGGAADDRNGVQRRASLCVHRRLLCHKIAHRYRTHYMEASPGLPEAIHGRFF